MRNNDPHMDYEYLGRYVFNCNSGSDPFAIASENRARNYFTGLVEGKKSMSLIIGRLVFEAQQRGKTKAIGQLTALYDDVWALTDNAGKDRINIAVPKRILHSVMDLAKEIIERDTFYF